MAARLASAWWVVPQPRRLVCAVVSSVRRGWYSASDERTLAAVAIGGSKRGVAACVTALCLALTAGGTASGAPRADTDRVWVDGSIHQWLVTEAAVAGKPKTPLYVIGPVDSARPLHPLAEGDAVRATDAALRRGPGRRHTATHLSSANPKGTPAWPRKSVRNSAILVWLPYQAWLNTCDARSRRVLATQTRPSPMPSRRVSRERMKGLEPSTFCMASRRSTN